MRAPAHLPLGSAGGYFSPTHLNDPMRAPHVDVHDPHDCMEHESWHGKGGMKFRTGLIASENHVSEALDFVRENYRQAGYATPDSLRPTTADSLTAAAKRHHKMIGTLSLWRDGPAGLQADEIYGDELNRLRRRGDRLGEFGRLAMDSRTPALTLLLSMVGKVAAAGCDRWHLTDFIVECNPRHVGFYTRMLGFSAIGEKRNCSQVGAPAVLLHVAAGHLLHVTRQFGHVARIKCIRTDGLSDVHEVEDAQAAGVSRERLEFATPKDEPVGAAGLLYGFSATASVGQPC